MRVLFICSGNICRSAMAAECMRERLERVGPAGVEVDSAGTLGIVGAPASPEAVQAAAEIGVDLRAHRSQGIDPERMARADLIVAMTHAHLSELATRYPRHTAERYVLRAFETSAQPDPYAEDLADPIGEQVQLYREQLVTITACVDHLASWLERRR